MTPRHASRPRTGPIAAIALVALAAGLLLPGCAGLRETMALRQVDFWLAGVRDVNLAGVRLGDVGGLEDLSASESALLMAAYGRNDLPLRMVIDVAALNPEENPDARLVGLDWSLMVREMETVEGTLTGPVPLPSGRTTTFPIAVELDLMRFFRNDLSALVDLAASVAGAGAGRPGAADLVPVALLAQPVIRTPAGPIRYPGLIRISLR